LTIDHGNTEHFGRGLTTALRLSAAVSILAAAGAPILARPVLAIFGPGYEQARYCLIAFATCTFAVAIKSIYIPARRAQGALGKAARAAALGAALELGAVELGLKLGGVTGVGIAFGTAMMLEAVFYWPTIGKARKSFGEQALGDVGLPVRKPRRLNFSRIFGVATLPVDEWPLPAATPMEESSAHVCSNACAIATARESPAASKPRRRSGTRY